MKATLKLQYPYFNAELVAYKDEAPPAEQTAPDGYNLLASYAYDGGMAFFNIYSKYQQTVTSMELLDGFDIPAETGILVIQGNMYAKGQYVGALDYIKPQTTGFQIEGEAIGFLVH
jgi:hypothetical protein